MAFVQLLQFGNGAYYSYSSADRQFGTQATINAGVSIAQQVHSNGDAEVGIGDISFANGAPMPPHASHTSGRNVDIRPLRRDRRRLPVTVHDQQYDREATRRLVQALRANPNVRSVLFNDIQIVGVQPWPGHDNHLHVNMHN